MVASGSWAPTSDCDIREEEEKGEKREQSNHEYSSKVLASKDLQTTRNLLIYDGFLMTDSEIVIHGIPSMTNSLDPSWIIKGTTTPENW